MNEIDAYIAGFPPETRPLLEQMRATIRAAAPEATERMAYQIPTFHLRQNLVHFAGYVRHVGFYPGTDAIEAFAAELAGYKRAKGSVQFPIDRPLPLDLVRRMTEYRVRAVTKTDQPPP